VGERARLIINDRADVALALAGAGAHLPASGLPVAAARALLGPDRLLGRSVHSIGEAVAAQQEGADYVIFGPVYETASKKPYGPPQGLAKLMETAAGVDIPVYAIGGIVPERAGEVRAAGAAGLVVMSFILEHAEPERAAGLLREAWLK